MNKITFPLESGIYGTEVADLQDALVLLLERGIIRQDDERSVGELRDERNSKKYGDGTARFIKSFQETRHLEPRGEESRGNVDEPTANAINALLKGWGLLDQQTRERLVVSGKVRRTGELPFKGCLVRAFHESDKGAIRLGEGTTDAEGRYTILYDPCLG